MTKTSPKKKLSIIIPCYNESLSIVKLIDKCLKILQDDIEIILVDNGSIDDTFNILKRLNLPNNIKPITIDQNIGYGNGILVGLKEAKGEILSWTHADLQTDPADVIIGYNQYKTELLRRDSVVKGERKNRNVLDAFFTLSMGVYCSIILKEWLYDINAQPKLFHSSFLDEFVNAPLDFSLDLYFIHFFKSKKIKIKTFPVYFNKRQYGAAKGGGTFKGKFKLIKRTLLYINQLKKNCVNGIRYS
jgi:glycosyltransferase involved in cell wall biosynthesis